MEAKVC